MIILTNPWLFKVLKYPPRGMALYPFVLLAQEQDAKDKILLHHEKIHLRQQLELLVLPFYLVYIGHYLIQLWRYKKHHLAYLNIVFEREAYHKESDLDYLRTRKLWAFGKYWHK